jgi:5-(carboxyamino)imidazole ribonucleotide mutase
MKKVAGDHGFGQRSSRRRRCYQAAEGFEIPFEAHVISAHRTPYEAEQSPKTQSKRRPRHYRRSGKAAHLAGVIAAYTTLPVIGLPIKSSTMDGLDSLLSMVQMPSGIPVATVAIGGADNAAILAAQILALSDAVLAQKLAAFKQNMAAAVIEKDKKLQSEVNDI